MLPVPPTLKKRVSRDICAQKALECCDFTLECLNRRPRRQDASNRIPRQPDASDASDASNANASNRIPRCQEASNRIPRGQDASVRIPTVLRVPSIKSHVDTVGRTEVFQNAVSKVVANEFLRGCTARRRSCVRSIHPVIASYALHMRRLQANSAAISARLRFYHSISVFCYGGCVVARHFHN
jgi:hypothetical protein